MIYIPQIAYRTVTTDFKRYSYIVQCINFKQKMYMYTITYTKHTHTHTLHERFASCVHDRAVCRDVNNYMYKKKIYYNSNNIHLLYNSRALRLADNCENKGK